MSVLEIYEQHIKPLSREEREQLEALMKRENRDEAKTHSVMEFHGVAAHSRIGMDAQEYVNQLRDEWDQKS